MRVTMIVIIYYWRETIKISKKYLDFLLKMWLVVKCLNTWTISVSFEALEVLVNIGISFIKTQFFGLLADLLFNSRSSLFLLCKSSTVCFWNHNQRGYKEDEVMIELHD